MSVIEIDLKTPSKMVFVLDLLRSLDFVAHVAVRPEVPEDAAKEPATAVSLFDQFYGSLPNLDVDAFENYLIETRNEWERPRS